MTSKMLTALDGSFDSRTRTVSSYLPGRAPIPPPPTAGVSEKQRIPAPQGDDATVILRFGKRARQQRVTQPAQLVAIQVVDEVVSRSGGVAAVGRAP
jgi:hypothetical protein